MRITRTALRATAIGRGYDPEEAMSSIIRTYDDSWVEVDTSHPLYPRLRRPALSGTVPDNMPAVAKPEPPEKPDGGPGTELKSLLRTIGITSSPTCSCNARAVQMDEWGPDVCESRMPEILAWLEGQAKARRLPFVRFAAEQAVKLAIRRARRKASQ